MNSEELCEMRANLKGYVQGVGFRATTHYHAVGLGLKGTVRNLDDGSVEIFAQGTKQQLEDLINKLKTEAGPIEVETVSVDFYPIVTKHSEFRIIH